jgi:hypothetical protein
VSTGDKANGVSRADRITCRTKSHEEVIRRRHHEVSDKHEDIGHLKKERRIGELVDKGRS